MRRALVYAAPSVVAAYLPSNYRVVDTTDDGAFIQGEDAAGWTLHDYVIPRLASGLIVAVETAKVKLKVENVYELYGTIVTWPEADVKLPIPDEDDDARRDWEYDNIEQFVGAGHPDGDAGYFAEIVESSLPDLIGMEFEFGL